MDSVTATLIVSVSLSASGTEPTTGSHAELLDCAALAAELDARRVPASWLLPPRPRDGRHRPDSALIGWLRRRVAEGDTLVMHGFNHTAVPLARTRIGPRAEFAGLPSHEASLRLIAATRTLDGLGLPADVFAPPRWLASSGTVDALARRGFAVCADGTGVRLLERVGGAGTLLRGRVLTAGGLGAPGGSTGAALGAALPAQAAYRWRMRTPGGALVRSPAAALVRAVERAARRGGLIRIAATATELSQATARRAVLDAVAAALAEGARPATYRHPVPASARLTNLGA